MKETGIIMSGDHPTKILAGTKTMTRRLTKLHEYNKEPDKWNIRPGVNCQFADSIERNKYNLPSQQIYIKCPYGLVGDRLWVRETWRIVGNDSGNLALEIQYKSDMSRKWSTVSQATFDKYTYDSVGWVANSKWRPSIFMPRWASRITLEITGLRAERLQEITEVDAIAEGVSYNTTNEYAQMRVLSRGQANEDTWPTPQESFRKLWDSINAKRGYGWDKNPWVWVIEFRRLP